MWGYSTRVYRRCRTGSTSSKRSSPKRDHRNRRNDVRRRSREASLLLLQSARRLAIVSDLARNQGSPLHHLSAPGLRKECNERCDGTAEQYALAADHIFGGDRRQHLVECIQSTPMVRPATVRYPLCVGWLMIAAFVALNISAIRAMRRAGTTVRPDR